MTLLDKETNQDYTFELNDSIVLNQNSDSWTEIPVKKAKPEDMLPGTVGLCLTHSALNFPHRL